MRLHHVGVVTPDVAASISLYTALGYQKRLSVADPVQHTHIVLLQRAEEPLIELITSTDSRSPVWTWLQRIKAGAYHMCYEVDDLQRATADLRRHGITRVYGPVPAVAFGMRRVVFLWGRPTGLIELLEV